MNNKSLVSVIVPVYNAQDHLNDCIKSIRNQKYKNIEIILVDDGSVDDSLSICIKQSKIDKRINVISKKNGGVSSARNIGLDRSKGQYILFVDSDDIIANDLITTLYDLLISNNCDVSICKVATFIGKIPITTHSDKSAEGIINNEKAMENLLYQKGIINGVFAKLYKRENIAKHKFHNKITYGEDMLFNFMVFSKLKALIITSDIKYYYRQRPGSAMNSDYHRKMMDSLDAAESINKYSHKYAPNLVEASELKLFIEALVLLTKIPRNNQIYYSDYLRCLNTIKKNRFGVVKNNKAKLVHRIYAIISYFSIYLLLILMQIKHKFKDLF